MGFWFRVQGVGLGYRDSGFRLLVLRAYLS